MQYEDKSLKEHFAKITQQLVDNEEAILRELKAGEGNAVDMGGYYHSNPDLTSMVMRPSATLNKIIG